MSIFTLTKLSWALGNYKGPNWKLPPKARLRTKVQKTTPLFVGQLRDFSPEQSEVISLFSPQKLGEVKLPLSAKRKNAKFLYACWTQDIDFWENVPNLIE